MSIENPEKKIEILPDDFQKRLQDAIDQFGESKNIGVMRTFDVDGEWRFTLGSVTQKDDESYSAEPISKQDSEAFMNQILMFGDLPDKYDWKNAITYEEEGDETIIVLDFPTLIAGT